LKRVLKALGNVFTCYYALRVWWLDDVPCQDFFSFLHDTFKHRLLRSENCLHEFDAVPMQANLRASQRMSLQIAVTAANNSSGCRCVID
jgi:hypothetical protein